MALLYIEGYDDDQWQERIEQAGGSVTNPATIDGRFGGLARRYNDGNRRDVYPVDNPDTVIVGVAFCRNDPNTGRDDDNGIVFMHDTSGDQCVMNWTSDGKIQFYRGNTLLGQTDPGVLPLDAWVYVEMKVTVDPSAGAIALRVNGATPPGWSDLTGINTSAVGDGQLDEIRFTGLRQWFGDDLYIADTTGGVNDDFLGDVRVETLYPSGNGTNSSLVGSDGNSVDNYALVDEAGTPNDSDYVGSGTDLDADTYAYQDLSTAIGEVFGVLVSSRLQKTDAGAISAGDLHLRGATTSGGPSHVLSASWQAHRTIWDKDPSDDAAWTIAKVNASEFGIEVRA